MGFLKGIGDSMIGVGKSVTAPFVGLGKAAVTNAETGWNVGKHVIALQPQRALDDIGAGLKKQGRNLAGISDDVKDGLKDAAAGLQDAGQSGMRLIGEPIRGSLRQAKSGISAVGEAGGHALKGNFGEAAGDLYLGGRRNLNIAGETVVNEFHNLFY